MKTVAITKLNKDIKEIEAINHNIIIDQWTDYALFVVFWSLRVALSWLLCEMELADMGKSEPNFDSLINCIIRME